MTWWWRLLPGVAGPVRSYRVWAYCRRPVRPRRSPAPSGDCGTRVIHNQPVLLVPENPVRPCDGLHERTVLHRLVQVDGGAGRHIEPGDPHGAHEHDAEGIIWILELAFQIRFFLRHPLSMRGDV